MPKTRRGRRIAMDYAWIKDYCLQKPGVETDFKEEWGAQRYLVADKMFAMECEDKTGRPILTFKQEPERGDFLRQAYPGTIVPGYYMNKVHWNSLYQDVDLPDELVREALDQAYNVMVQSLPRKAREALTIES